MIWIQIGYGSKPDMDPDLNWIQLGSKPDSHDGVYSNTWIQTSISGSYGSRSPVTLLLLQASDPSLPGGA